MPEYMSPKQLQDIKDVREAVEKILKLRKQRQMPDRYGMISALQEARDKAPVAVLIKEWSQGDTKLMPPEQFTNEDLYRKLSQYEQALEAYCIEKIGKEAFDELIKEK